MPNKTDRKLVAEVVELFENQDKFFAKGLSKKFWDKEMLMKYYEHMKNHMSDSRNVTLAVDASRWMGWATDRAAVHATWAVMTSSMQGPWQGSSTWLPPQVDHFHTMHNLLAQVTAEDQTGLDEVD